MAGFDVEKARREFSIFQDHEPVAVAAIGYPGSSGRTARQVTAERTGPATTKTAGGLCLRTRLGTPGRLDAESLGRGDVKIQKNRTKHPATSSAIAHNRSKLSHVCRSSRKPTFSYVSKNTTARTPATANMLAVCISTASPIVVALNDGALSDKGVRGIPPAMLCVITDIGCAIRTGRSIKPAPWADAMRKDQTNRSLPPTLIPAPRGWFARKSR